MTVCMSCVCGEDVSTKSTFPLTLSLSLSPVHTLHSCLFIPSGCVSRSYFSYNWQFHTLTRCLFFSHVFFMITSSTPLGILTHVCVISSKLSYIFSHYPAPTTITKSILLQKKCYECLRTEGIKPRVGEGGRYNLS